MIDLPGRRPLSPAAARLCRSLPVASRCILKRGVSLRPDAFIWFVYRNVRVSLSYFFFFPFLLARTRLFQLKHPQKRIFKG